MSMSPKAKAREALLVSAINTALERGLIELESSDSVKKGSFEFQLGGLPVLAYVSSSDYEIWVQVMVDPTELGRQCLSAGISHQRRQKYAGAMSAGWLERQRGKYLQHGVMYSGRRETTQTLSALSVEPRGYWVKRRWY